MAQHSDVLILGGGVIGLTTAYLLAKEGAKVAIVDKGGFGRESSWAGAGILSAAPTLERAKSGPELLAAHSARLFPALAAELRERTGIDTGYRPCGGIEIVDRWNSAVENDWTSAGIPFEKPSAERIGEAEPALRIGDRQAYAMPSVGQVRNPHHLKALLGACALQNVAMHAGSPVFALERNGERITTAKTGAGSLSASKFLITAGAWSGGLLATLGLSLSVRPVRGQIALLRTEPGLLWRVIQHGKRYLVPRPDGRVLIGSTEEEVGFHKATTAEGIAGLLSFAYNLAPRLADAEVERTWAGLRPGSPDGLPYVGAVPGMENLYVAAGHYRAGIQLSSGTALVMKELLLEQKLTFPIEDFRVRRR